MKNLKPIPGNVRLPRERKRKDDAPAIRATIYDGDILSRNGVLYQAKISDDTGYVSVHNLSSGDAFDFRKDALLSLRSGGNLRIVNPVAVLHALEYYFEAEGMADVVEVIKAVRVLVGGTEE